MNNLLYDPHVEGYLEHYGTKGMRWGVRKNDVKQFFTSGSKESQIGKQIVAGILVSYGALKLASFTIKKTKHVVNKGLNKIDPYERSGKIRETGRYYDKKLGDWVYTYG